MEQQILSLDGWLSSVASLEARLGRLKDDEVRKSDLLLARVRSGVINELKTVASASDALKRRLSVRKLHLATRVGNPEVNKLFAFSDAGLVDADDDLVDIREAEYLGIVRSNWNTAVIEADGHHFIAPSGFHVQRFLKVANAIKSREDTEKLAFWILDDVQWADAVIVDTWGVSPIALWAFLELNIKNPLIRSIEPYDETTKDRVRRILAEVLQDPRVKKVLFVTSVCSTGSMQETIAQVVSEHQGAVDARQISLFAFSDAKRVEKIYCNIPDAQNIEAPDQCALCKKDHLQLETIHPEDYAIRYSTEQPEMIGKKEFKTASELVKGYGEFRAALTVHRDDPNDRRHHAFYVDFSQLLKVEGFKKKYIEKLTRKIADADIVVVPRHPMGSVIELLARENGAQLIIRHDNLRIDENITLDQIQLLKSAQKLLILDDITLTGSRLQNYCKSIREQEVSIGSFTNVEFFVGLARPDNLEKWEKICNGIKKGHTWAANVEAVETVVLPYWTQNQCPWCHEYEVLTQIAYHEARPEPWLSKRIAQLSAKNLGIASPCLCLGADMDEPVAGGSSPLVNSGASAIEAVFVLASSVQHLRITKSLGRKYPKPIVLDSDNLIGRYTECLFQSVLLKSTTQSEWSLNDRRFIISKFLDSASENHGKFLAIEIILQIKRGLLSYVGNEARVKSLVIETWGKHADIVLKEIGLDREFQTREQISTSESLRSRLGKILQMLARSISRIFY